MTRAVSWPSWFAIVALGCASGPGPDEQAATQAIETFVPHQGRQLLGFKGGDLRYVTMASLPQLRVDSHGRLSDAVRSGTAFAGIEFDATDASTTYRMRFARVLAPVAPETQWQYVLQQRDASGAWLPACDDPAQLIPQPPELPIRAYALSGVWLPDGTYRVTNGNVSFACKTGVVGKCILWGYGRDASWPSTTLNGVVTHASSVDMLQACTRMARADYCASGLPNTLDGTPIHIDDVFKPLVPEDGFAFEAAWPGTAWVDRVPTRPPLVCLSKLRWASMPLGGNCPLTIPDPRRDVKGTFCEDMPALTMESKGALLYSSSTFIDAGLYTYVDPATRQRLTTGNLLPGKVGSLPSWIIPPPPDVNYPIIGGPDPTFEATIFARKLPPAIPETSVIKLASFRCPTGLVTTTGTPGCALIADEGWIYPPGTPDRAPLRQWYNPVDKTRWTTPRSPTTMLGDGWQLEAVLGGVLRAAIDVNVRWSYLGPGWTYALDVQTRTGEWIPKCASGLLDVELAFRDRCANPLRDVNHTDVLAFRVTATSAAGTITSPPQLYDGFSSDVYLPIGGGETTAVVVAWPAYDAFARYEVSFDDGSGMRRCEGPDQLAGETSYLHVGKCHGGSGQSVTVALIKEVRVCALKEDKALACGTATYDGTSAKLEVGELKAM